VFVSYVSPQGPLRSGCGVFHMNVFGEKNVDLLRLHHSPTAAHMQSKTLTIPRWHTCHLLSSGKAVYFTQDGWIGLWDNSHGFNRPKEICLKVPLKDLINVDIICCFCQNSPSNDTSYPSSSQLPQEYPIGALWIGPTGFLSTHTYLYPSACTTPP
jgi:hypothetical protein